MFTIRTRGLHRASFSKSPHQVLDLGCGTGIWTRQFAAKNPNSTAIGVDLNLALAEETNETKLPQNCSFITADIEKEWGFSSQSDYIYMRMIMIAVKDWPALLRRTFANLNPGGQLEVFDGLMHLTADDGSTAASSASIHWFELSKEYLAKHDIAWDLSRDLPDQMTKAGFEMVESETIKMRLYQDSRDPEADRDWVAANYRKDISDIVHGMTKRMRTDLASRMSPEEWDTLEQNARHEILEESEQRGFHTTL